MEIAARLYSDIRELTGRVPVTELLDRLFYDGGYRSYLESDRSIRGYEEHYEYIWEEANKAGDVFSFIEKMEESLGDMSQMDTDLLRLREKGVKMMTIHKSKGLEVPIVIVANAFAGSSKSDPNPLVIDPRREFIAIDKSPSHSLRKLIHQCRVRRENAELKRLLYVALTRAEVHLAVVGTEGKRATSDTLGHLYEEAIEPLDVERCTFSLMSEEDALKRRRGEKDRLDLSYYEEKVVERPPARTLRMSTKEYGHEMDNYDPSSSGPVLPRFGAGADEIMRKVRDGKPMFGTLCHETLEAKIKGLPLPRCQAPELDDAERLVLEREAERISSSFFSCEYFRKELEGHELIAEKGFYFPYDGMVLEGSIDLLVRMDDHFLVVDYKTDERRDPEKHRNQLSLYCRAVEAVYGKKALGRVIYLRDMSTGPLWDSEGNEVR